MTVSVKRELSTLVQYMIIAYIVGNVCFVLLTPGDVDAASVWKGYQTFFQRWMGAVAALGALRLVILYVAASYKRRRMSMSPSAPVGTHILKQELKLVVQYAVIALLAGMLAFLSFIASVDGAVNIGVAWSGYQPMLYSWLVGVALLGGLRLAGIYAISLLTHRAS